MIRPISTVPVQFLLKVKWSLLWLKAWPKERIIQGLHQSVARRIASLAGDDLEDEIYLDGGAAA